MIPFPFTAGQLGRQNSSQQVVPFTAVKFISNFTGTNGQTSATDSSASARAITFNANAQISTAQSAYGDGSSLYLDGVGDYLSMPDSADWAPTASQDFHWEFVLMPDGTFAANADLLSQATGTGNYPYRIYRQSGANGGLGVLMVNSAGANIVNATGGNIPNNEWSHVAVVREGSTVRGYIRGKLVLTATSAGAALFDAANTLKIGIFNPPGGAAFKGWIQCSRFGLNYCRYPSGVSFTPPTKLFETS